MNNCQQILEQLQRDFPNAQSDQNFNNPYELIVAVILSAQALADMPLDLLEDTIRSCGFYHNKAKHLKSMAADVVSKYGGQVPSNLADLQTLAGVGRKTANVVYAVAFGGQAIAVDTHVFRVANRLGIVTATNVLDTEKQLMAVIPQDRWADSHHHILLHGRYVCKAQKPNCAGCSVSQWCRYFKEHND